MTDRTSSTSNPTDARRAKARRNAVLLGLLALAFYLTFIGVQVLHSRPH